MRERASPDEPDQRLLPDVVREFRVTTTSRPTDDIVAQGMTDEVARLRARVAELEARLAALDQSSDKQDGETELPRASVNDATEHNQTDAAMQFLVNASTVLSESLEY